MEVSLAVELASVEGWPDPEVSKLVVIPESVVDWSNSVVEASVPVVDKAKEVLSVVAVSVVMFDSPVVDSGSLGMSDVPVDVISLEEPLVVGFVLLSEVEY